MKKREYSFRKSEYHFNINHNNTSPSKSVGNISISSTRQKQPIANGTGDINQITPISLNFALMDMHLVLARFEQAIFMFSLIALVGDLTQSYFSFVCFMHDAMKYIAQYIVTKDYSRKHRSYSYAFLIVMKSKPTNDTTLDKIEN